MRSPVFDPRFDISGADTFRIECGDQDSIIRMDACLYFGRIRNWTYALAAVHATEDCGRRTFLSDDLRDSQYPASRHRKSRESTDRNRQRQTPSVGYLSSFRDAPKTHPHKHRELFAGRPQETF